MLPGCASTPPRLYVLVPLTARANGTAANGAAANGGAAHGPDPRAIGVRVATLPEYLDRSEVVSYVGPNELSADGDHRWAERLTTNVTRVLAESLSALLHTDRVRVLPSRDIDRFDCEVTVEVDRFERTVAGDSALDAHWTVRDGATQKVLIRDQTSRAVHVPDDHYAALVAAMNDNLAALSQDIASAIARLPRKGGGRMAG